jgi:hypothetical protein
MADHDDAGGWDLIVTPWHIDEHIPAFPVPMGVAETIRPSLPDGSVSDRMTLLHRAVADAVARAARPLLLSGDCPAAAGALAGLQSRQHRLRLASRSRRRPGHTRGDQPACPSTRRRPGLAGHDAKLRLPRLSPTGSARWGGRC